LRERYEILISNKVMWYGLKCFGVNIHWDGGLRLLEKYRRKMENSFNGFIVYSYVFTTNKLGLRSRYDTN